MHDGHERGTCALGARAAAISLPKECVIADRSSVGLYDIIHELALNVAERLVPDTGFHTF